VPRREGSRSATNDVYDIYGMAVAHETVGLLRRLGATPARAGLMQAARSMSSPNTSFLLPGVAVKTGEGRQLPGSTGPAPALDEGPLVSDRGLWVSKRN
jgi:hypothetical protein